MNIAPTEQALRLENHNRLEALVLQAWELQRELKLRPLPHLIPAPIDSEAGGVPPGVS